MKQQKGKEEKKKQNKTKNRNHPIDGSLSASNPALDTLSGYHGEKKKLGTKPSKHVKDK